LEMQWKNMTNVKFTLKSDCKAEELWVFLYNYKDVGDNYIFRDIASFALMVLSLPVSNAVVERVFSAMNINKTKLRNKINMAMLDSLLRIRIHLHVNKIC
jgi:hypothetical protein